VSAAPPVLSDDDVRSRGSASLPIRDRGRRCRRPLTLCARHVSRQSGDDVRNQVYHKGVMTHGEEGSMEGAEDTSKEDEP
jgi:hypothetical protein